MKIFYDTEFLERGNQYPVVPISIGMVREDGKTLYLVNRDAPVQEILDHEWLRMNVWPHIKHYFEMSTEERAARRYTDFRPANDWQGPIQGFCREGLDFDVDGSLRGPTAELWAYYADYDHVVMAQSFGTMVTLPAHMPMFTHDLKQAQQMLLPDHKFGPPSIVEHDALADARWVQREHARLRDAVIERFGLDLL